MAGVVIAGGGPTGLMLAGELALAGVDVVIVERRASQDRRLGLNGEAFLWQDSLKKNGRGIRLLRHSFS